jgi:VWFA-related protein
VVILLSDGIDVESVLGIEDVLWKARRSQALVYWIRLQDQGAQAVTSRTSSWRDSAGHAAEISGLTRVVNESGGRVVDLDRIENAAGAFRVILQELREQYVLGYYPSANLNDGRWHKVQVRVDGFNLVVRSREGYVDF